MKRIKNGGIIFSKILPFFFLIFFSTPLWGGDFLPVLVYHHITASPSSDVSCTPDQFREQVVALLKTGHTFLSLDRARLYLLGALPNVRRPILLTFDDGYESVYSHAFPLASQLNAPMTVFLVTSRIGLKPQFISYLSKDQIRKMSDSGVISFGSHSHDLHVNNLTLFDAFHSTPNPFLRHLHRDLAESKKILEELSGQKILALAWPYGKFNWAMTEVARGCGFSLHFTSQGGYNEPGSNPLGIKRIPITQDDTPVTVLKKVRN